MTSIKARQELKRVGCSHATGDALRFMCAGIVANQHRFQTSATSKAGRTTLPEKKLYAYFQENCKNDNDSLNLVRELRAISPEVNSRVLDIVVGD